MGGSKDFRDVSYIQATGTVLLSLILKFDIIFKRYSSGNFGFKSFQPHSEALYNLFCELLH